MGLLAPWNLLRIGVVLFATTKFDCGDRTFPILFLVLQRLILDEAKLDVLLSGIEDVIALPDPLGEDAECTCSSAATIPEPEMSLCKEGT